VSLVSKEMTRGIEVVRVGVEPVAAPAVRALERQSNTPVRVAKNAEAERRLLGPLGGAREELKGAVLKDGYPEVSGTRPEPSI
jgi:hypothetical protein